MPPWSELLAVARQQVEETLTAVPPALGEAARALPVTYEKSPSPDLIRDGLEPDLLGLFVGDPKAEEGVQPAVPAQVFLFLENIWDFAESDWEIFREEVQTTYLHELGHYLGLGEMDLEDRGLE